jgi:biopolymer transport protein ExbD
MAELDTSGGGQKKGKGKKHGSKKKSTRVDLTPMVDLGFLLVTFFMLTTTFSQPQTMEINMPVKDKQKNEQQAVKESKAMTIILGGEDKIYYYMGITNPQLDTTNYSADGIRKIILEKNREIQDLVVLIKPTSESKYKNVVDILDEMDICAVKRYALVDISPMELDLIKKLNK